MPKASAPGFRLSASCSAQSREGVLYKKALRAVSNHSGGLAPTASVYPLASALGSLPRRDPGSAVRTYHEGSDEPFKLGTFYLAGNRNFLFGSDTVWCNGMVGPEHFG